MKTPTQPPPPITAEKLEQLRIEKIGARVGLSPRQSAIAALVHAEESLKLIADALGGSEHTVKTQLRRIYSKLNARGRVGLALSWERAAVAVAQMGDATKGDATKIQERVK